MMTADGDGVSRGGSGAAESAYQALDEIAKAHARRILLGLIFLDDALRPQWHSMPEPPVGDAEPTRETALRKLQAADVITVHRGDDNQPRYVSVGSEALLENWPRLCEWVAGNRADLLARQKVAAAGAAWHERGRRDADLWSGSRIAIAERLTDGTGGDVELLDHLSKEFIAASRDRGRRVGGRALRRRRVLTAGGCALLLVACGTWLANDSPDGGAAQNAVRSQQLVTDAEALSGNPSLAEQLALAAYRYSPSQSATDLLYEMLSLPSDSTMAKTGSGILHLSAALDAPVVAASSKDRSFRIWNLADQKGAVLEATVRGVPAAALALSPDGTDLVAACRPDDLCLWDLSDVRHPKVEAFMNPKSAGPSLALTSIAFSPDGTLVAAAAEEGKTFVWSVRDPVHPRLVATLPNPMTAGEDLAAVAFSARDDLLAETIQDGRTRMWNLKDPTHPVLVATIGTGFQGLAFSPDGGMLAAAGDTRVSLWSLANPARPRPIDIQNACTTGSSGSTLDLHTVAFSPGGDQIAYSGEDTTDSQATVCIFNLSSANLDSGSPTAVSVPTDFTTFSLTYTSTGELLTAGPDGLIRQWRPPLQQIDGLVPAAHGTTFDISPDGRLLAGALAGPSFEPVGVGIWDVSTPAGPVLDATIPVDAQDVIFLTSRLLLTATGTGQVQLWDLSNPQSPREGASLGTAVIPANNGWSYSGEVNDNSAGNLVAVLGADDALHLWHVASAYDVRQLSSIPAGAAQQGPAGILPDGRTALFGTSTGIQWWGIKDPAHPVREGFTILPHVNVGMLGAAGSMMALGTPPGSGSSAVLDLADLGDGIPKSLVTITASASDAFGIADDGSLLAVTGDDGKSLTLWSTRNPGHPRRLATISVPQAQEIDFSSPATSMAVLSKGTVQVWSLRDPGAPALEETVAPPGVSQYLFEAEFAGSGPLFVDDFSTVYVVDVSPADLAERLCSSLGSAVTPVQWQRYAPGIPYLNPCSSSAG
jgi:WD40 repeat protein